MGTQQSIELHFPLKGLVRKTGYSDSPPFASPDCLNVRPDGNSVGRERGGSRPRLAKAFSEQVSGASNPIRMMNAVQLAPVMGAKFFEDDFSAYANGSDLDASANWDAASWVDDNLTVASGGGAYVWPAGTLGDEHGTLLKDLNIDQTRRYTVTCNMDGAPTALNNTGTTSLYVGMDDSSPDADTASIEVRVRKFWYVPTGDTRISLSIHQTVGGVTTVLSADPAGGDAKLTVDTELVVSVTNSQVAATVRVAGGGSTLSSKTVGISTPAGTRMGLSITCTGNKTNTTTGSFAVSYLEPAATKPNVLVASANGELWYENATADMVKLTGADLNSLDLASDRRIYSAERVGYLYIADSGAYRGSGTTATINTSVLDDAAVGSWNAIADVGDIVWITSAVAAGNVGEWVVQTVHDTNGLTLSGSGKTTTNQAGATIEWSILRGPKRFNASDPELEALPELVRASGSGQVPGGCPLIAVYRDRIVLGGSPVAPHVWYMSAISDPLNWDYGASDLNPARAIAGTTADAEKLAEPLTALVASSTDYLLFGCKNSLWRLQGDPAAGGSIVNLSRTIGIISQGAWCHGPSGEVIFLSRSGVHMLPPGASAFPQAISSDILPDELIDIDPDTNTVSMRYDTFDDGVHIYVTGTQSSYWWMDWGSQTFWPLSFNTDHEPTAITTYKDAGGGISDVLVGCDDGYIRRFLDTSDDDDGETLTSSVTYGPIRLGGDNFRDGMLLSLDGALASDSGDVTWQVLVGETHEDAVNAGVFDSGTWSAGLNHTVRPRARGGSFCLRLTATTAWECERITAVRERLGRQRLG